MAVVGSSVEPGYAQALKELELAAGVLKVTLQYLDVLAPKDIETAFRAASKGRAEAAHVLASPILSSQRTQILDCVVKSRIPVIYSLGRSFVEDGGLMSYGVSLTDLPGALRRMWTRF